MVGDSLAKNVTLSARFYAVLNYALANAAIASWDTKYFYNSWRPITALNYNASIYLASNTSLVDPSWTPLLDPTPNHQNYLSTHATFGAAAGAVISLWNEGDEIDVQLSSNVTRIKQVITRRTTSIKQAVKAFTSSMRAMLAMRSDGGSEKRRGKLLRMVGISFERLAAGR